MSLGNHNVTEFTTVHHAACPDDILSMNKLNSMLKQKNTNNDLGLSTAARTDYRHKTMSLLRTCHLLQWKHSLSIVKRSSRSHWENILQTNPQFQSLRRLCDKRYSQTICSADYVI